MSLLHASRVAALCASLVLGSTLVGCSSDEPSEESAPRTPMDASDVLGSTLEVRTSVTRVLGELSQPQREKLEGDAARLVSGYFAAAYLRERPSDGYRGSFPGFTRGARELALKDVSTASNAAFAGAEEVRARGAAAFVSVVAPEGRPVGATARVFLDLAVAEGARNRLVQVSGRLLLTPVGDGWRIFGYDLSLDTVAGKGGAR